MVSLPLDLFARSLRAPLVGLPSLGLAARSRRAPFLRAVVPSLCPPGSAVALFRGRAFRSLVLQGAARKKRKNNAVTELLFWELLPPGASQQQGSTHQLNPASTQQWGQAVPAGEAVGAAAISGARPMLSLLLVMVFLGICARLRIDVLALVTVVGATRSYLATGRNERRGASFASVFF